MASDCRSGNNSGTPQVKHYIKCFYGRGQLGESFSTPSPDDIGINWLPKCNKRVREKPVSTEPFDDLLMPHLEAMRRFVRRRVRTQDDVDDVVQRTLLLAFVHRNQLRNPAKFKSWLCSIAVNEIRMILRATKRCVSLTVCPEVDAVETIDSPFTRLQERERLAHLRSAMTRLHERDQAAIQRELDGLSVAQAAAATATSIAAAKSARFRARQRLAIAMRNQCIVRAVGNSR